MKYYNNKVNNLNYNFGWLKTKLYDNIVLSSIDLDILNTIIDKIDLLIFRDYVVLRTSLNKRAIKNIILKWYVKSINNSIELLVFKSKIKGLNYEMFINKYEFMKIKLNNLLYVSVFDLDETIISFDVKSLLKCLHETRVVSTTMIINQSNLQQNLKYNLNNKIKEYINQVNIVDDLEEQYEMMKKRLLIEVNMPRLVVKKWKTDINW